MNRVVAKCDHCKVQFDLHLDEDGNWVGPEGTLVDIGWDKVRAYSDEHTVLHQRSHFLCARCNYQMNTH